jgi:hypothetical protein
MFCANCCWTSAKSCSQSITLVFLSLHLLPHSIALFCVLLWRAGNLSCCFVRGLLDPAARQADMRLVWGLAAAVRRGRDLGGAVCLALCLLAAVKLYLGLVTTGNLF